MDRTVVVSRQSPKNVLVTVESIVGMVSRTDAT